MSPDTIGPTAIILLFVLATILISTAAARPEPQGIQTKVVRVISIDADDEYDRHLMGDQ